MNSVFSHKVIASGYLTDCHQVLFFQQDSLAFFKDLVIDRFYWKIHNSRQLKTGMSFRNCRMS